MGAYSSHCLPVSPTQMVCPVDGAKIGLPEGARERVRTHPLLAGSWRFRGVGKGGHERYTATWGAWTFIGDATRCWHIRGSFHKAHNGGTNWQDYTYAQFAQTAAALCDAFGLHPAGLRLINLEVGVNVVPPIPTAEVLRSIVQHKSKAPVPMHEGQGLEIAHAAFKYKVYDKGFQHHLPGELLRVEVKATRARTLVPLGVRTVADLLDPGTWPRLSAFLLAKFDELLIVEPSMPMDGLRPAQRELLAKASDPTYWKDMATSTRSRRLKTLDTLYRQHVPHMMKDALRAAIVTKLSDLTERDICHKGTTMRRSAPSGTNATRGCRTPAPPRQGENGTNTKLAIRVANVPLSVPVASAIPAPAEVPSDGVRSCLACGRDITHQDARSRTCSERLYGKAGKRCRNALSNRTLSLSRMDARSIPLFDQRPFLAQ